MRRRTGLGITCIVLGLLMLAAAAGLLLYNQQEAQQAEAAVQERLPRLVETIQHRQQSAPQNELSSPNVIPPDVLFPEETQLPVAEVDGLPYVGFLTIPALELELPVLAEWNESLLKLSPCRYAGDRYTDDLVIMAHNYVDHFGRLQDLRAGDTVIFTDMDANSTTYTVQALDVLQPSDVEAMTDGSYDLTLFTCTYTGDSRIAVRCDRA